MSGQWQVQEAKQRFSELIRAVRTDGPQFVTRHGDQVAVVLDIGEYRRLRGEEEDFKDFLASAPDFTVLEIDRSTTPVRVIEFGGDE
jgi:prevent-host-death family protein